MGEEFVYLGSENGFQMFHFIETIFPILFIGVFLFILIMIVINISKGLTTYHRNNQSPVLTVTARIVGKRTHVSQHHHDDNMHTHFSTTYYVTFQVESGDRMEFCVKGEEYGLLVEGDCGNLTFQGTRYLSFRQQNP